MNKINNKYNDFFKIFIIGLAVCDEWDDFDREAAAIVTSEKLVIDEISDLQSNQLGTSNTTDTVLPNFPNVQLDIRQTNESSNGSMNAELLAVC